MLNESNTWSTDAQSWFIGKDPDAGKDWRQEEKGWQRMRWLNGIVHSNTWVCANPGRQWGTGKPGVMQFMGLQRVRHDLAMNNKKSATGSSSSRTWGVQTRELSMNRVNTLGIYYWGEQIILEASSREWKKERERLPRWKCRVSIFYPTCGAGKGNKTQTKPIWEKAQRGRKRNCFGLLPDSII